LQISANKLLSSTDFMMLLLAPKPENYLRFNSKINLNLFKKGKFSAPINLSFGGDNRTCAIRVPALTKEKPGKRLEYRLACAEADQWLCMAAILIALIEVRSLPDSNSIQEKTNFEQIFGNAFDQKYELKEFCNSYEEANRIFFSEENFIRKKFEEFLAIEAQ
jgi:glutamine synthetase